MRPAAAERRCISTTVRAVCAGLAVLMAPPQALSRSARDDRVMDERRRLAALALRLVEGVEAGDEHADALLADALGSYEAAALAHAYLSGFVLRLLADERQESIGATVARVRLLLVQG
jgi:hypothetical protein